MSKIKMAYIIYTKMSLEIRFSFYQRF